MLKSILSAGIKGTKGTLNLRPILFWWWATITSIPVNIKEKGMNHTGILQQKIQRT